MIVIFIYMNQCICTNRFTQTLMQEFAYKKWLQNVYLKNADQSFKRRRQGKIVNKVQKFFS
jgi:hypothetical protein